MARIKFKIPDKLKTKITVIDILGKEVKTLVDSKLNPGSHEIEFDGANLPSGVYFYRLETEGIRETKKIEIIK